ncbi:acyl-CoA dehydrogenase [Nocardioidaceae bacterium Broad-1]|uniref:acyl-CoA dehydrogenase n=1 Tax=Nocardioides luteus TaxID=1844 RepID=UPI0002028D48|nr:acyl-CoA dehydrogenase [Nocardioides luteus]EGD45535.1 acyl-CoA dehydrogenase [Nocardioidaceae bacterium Broad-1]MBG6094315.1 alkylation response protein AidB-like acyl-CoA dehydrogenase [Nocardioides luteus]
MSHYKSNLRDIEFNLFEVFGTDKVLGTGPFADLDVDTAKEILAEVERLSREDLAESFVEADRNPPVFDPKTNTAPVPAAFKKSYDAWMESGFWSLQTPEEIGGQVAPNSLIWATAEMLLGANPAIWMYGAGPFFSKVVYENGNDRDKRIAEIMVERLWGSTMVLTEPDAGSDVGAGKTFATPNEDGSWNITGVKRFITSAESDLQENIMHLVLARPKGVEGVGGPGTKGLSLFLVPKYHFDHETGELTGERNGAYVTNVEHKMGIKVSNTCELTFGDPQVGGGEPAKGWLLGEVHDGIRQMFDVIENARMMVGTKAIATLSTGYLNALEYAKTRVQGADLTKAAKTDPRVTITHHPDVRRSLLVQKSFAEGMRALVYYTTSWQEKVVLTEDGSDENKLAAAVNDLLLPIVKGYGSERAWTLLGTESLQTFGGSGFLQEYPIEQYVRDAKIDSIYEGTTAIQGQDFFFRKIVKNQGAALGQIAGEIQAFLDNEGSAELKESRALLATALEDVNAIVGHMFNDLMASQEEITNIYKVAQNTSRLLLAVGDVVVAWLLLRQAEIALAALAGDPGKDKDFYTGKVAAAKFFASYNLPKLTAERAIAEAIDNSIMDLPESAF